MIDQKVRAAVAEAARIDDPEFSAYGGGWQGQIGTASVDAVFSTRARYQAEDPRRA